MDWSLLRRWPRLYGSFGLLLGLALTAACSPAATVVPDSTPAVTTPSGETASLTPSASAFETSDVDEKPTCAPLQGLNIHAFYPPEARDKKLEGVVNLMMLIQPDGRISKATITSDPGGGLGLAALEMLRR